MCPNFEIDLTGRDSSGHALRKLIEQRRIVASMRENDPRFADAMQLLQHMQRNASIADMNERMSSFIEESRDSL